MTLTMAELSGLGGVVIHGRRNGWVQITTHEGGPGTTLQDDPNARWVRESAYRRMVQREAGSQWWGDTDPYSKGVGVNPPFDPRLGRNVRNVREWQSLQRAKSRSNIPGNVRSKADWRKHMKARRAERRRERGTSRERREEAARLRERGDQGPSIGSPELERVRNDENQPAWKRRAADRELRRRANKEARERRRERARAAARARREKEISELKKQSDSDVRKARRKEVPPGAKRTPIRYRSPARTGPSISSGGTTITKRIKVPDFAQVVRRPVTGGSVTYGGSGDPLLDLQRKTRAAFDKRVGSGGPLSTGGSTYYSAGTSGLGALAASEGAVLSSLSGGLSGLG